MTNRELATLVLKLMGVYCLILVVGAIPSVAMWLGIGIEEETLWPLVAGGASLLLYTALGVSLIWKSGWFVGLVVTKSAEPEPEPARSTPSDLQGVFFSVVGVVLVVHALPSILFIVISHSLRKSPEGFDPPTIPFPWPDLARVAVELALGVALFLGSAGLTRIWRRINEMNQAPKGLDR